MISDVNLLNIIENLIALRKEGDFWDFKKQWHNNKVCFARDVLSLANNPYYEEQDRFLIFGVSDEFDVVGIEENELKKQSDIVDLFRRIFMGSISPDISLHNIIIKEKNIQVLVIKDEPSRKPFLITKDYADGKEKLIPNIIYSRYRDANSYKNEGASLYEMEKIWKQRFGINRTPLERLFNYVLNDTENWTSCVSHNAGLPLLFKAYYNIFPEFTISTSRIICGGNDKDYFSLCVMYHNTYLLGIPPATPLVRKPKDNFSKKYHIQFIPYINRVEVDNFILYAIVILNSAISSEFKKFDKMKKIEIIKQCWENNKNE